MNNPRFNLFGIATTAIAAGLSSFLLSSFTPLPTTPDFPSRTWISVDFPDSPGGNGPDRTASGGSRSSCSVEGVADGVTPMTVLMPENNIGTTSDADPNLYVYLPKHNINGAQVVIIDPDTDDEIYVRDFSLDSQTPAEPGIIKLHLAGANLQPDTLYEWILVPFCRDRNNQPEYIQTFVEGRFQRLSLSDRDRAELTQAPTLEAQAQVYARARLWNETLAIVEQLRDRDPQAWKGLLNSVGLENLVAVPYWGEARIIAIDAESR
jgi:hypothetical protein